VPVLESTQQHSSKNIIGVIQKELWILFQYDFQSFGILGLNYQHQSKVLHFHVHPAGVLLFVVFVKSILLLQELDVLRVGVGVLLDFVLLKIVVVIESLGAANHAVFDGNQGAVLLIN